MIRRLLLAALAFTLLSASADARSSRAYSHGQPPTYPPLTPSVHLSMGQSWRDNGFDCMGCLNINPQSNNVLTLGVSNPNYPSGVEYPASGISLVPVTGLVNYTPSMLGFGQYPGNAALHDGGSQLTIGRAAVLAQTALRIANGKTVTPILEYTDAYPSCDWWEGPTCGGLGTGAVLTASITGNTSLNVTAQSGNPMAIGQFLTGAGVGTGRSITALGTCTSSSVPCVAAITSGANVGSESMTAVGSTWTNLLSINASVQALTPASRPIFLNAATFKSVGLTQGGDINGNYANTLTQFTQWEAAIDALNLPGAGTTGMAYYIGERGALSEWTVMNGSVQGIRDFVRANANGRTFGTNPWYQYPYNDGGPNDIHFGDYGTICGVGQYEGYQTYVHEDEGVSSPNPLWDDPATPASLSGNVLTIPFVRPSGAGFASSVLQLAATPNEGISFASQMGFDIKDNGFELPVTNVAISGMNVLLTLKLTPSSGDSITYAYAWYGPGGITQGQSGIWGNLMMAGPASAFPWCATQSTLGGTINAWAWPIEPTTITAP